MIRLLIPLLIVLALMAYIGWHLWQMLPLSQGWRATVIAVCIGMVFLMVASIFGRNHLSETLIGSIYYISTAWLFILLYMVLAFVVIDVVRAVVPAVRPWFVHHWGGVIGVAVVLLLVFAYGNWRYHHKVRTELTVETGKPLLRDYRLVALSDLHLGYTIGRKELARWVDLINKEKPDAVVIAGDIIDNSVRPVLRQAMQEELRRLKAPLGVYACFGNHDHLAGTGQSGDFFHQAGIRLLRDEVVLVDSAFYVAGRDDRTNSHRKPTAKILSNLDLRHPIILLDHQPYHLKESERAGVDFQLSGHTHRGQVFPINIITDVIYECSHGYHRLGRTHYYVSEGIGLWGGKFRIGSKSEYTVVTLKGTRP